MTIPEKTFTGFTPEQAAAYASGRGGSYPLPIYESMLKYHQGERKVLLDVGTGPGKAVFDLMPYFDKGVGVDSSVGMIEQAKKDAVTRGFASTTGFFAYTGEDCDKAVQSHQVDVITVAMAAHWIDMPVFYKAAERALRPGGTLAMWTASSFYVHPSTPNAAAIQDALYDLEDRMLADYRHPGNILTRNAYDDLPLPWTIGNGFESTFDKASFTRVDWDREGVPSAPPLADGTPGPFVAHKEEKISHFEMGVGSASSVIRWREKNADKAFTDEDPVVITVKRLRERSGGKEALVMGPSFSLLLMRKS